MNASAASQLCTACGMCCDGTLFAFVAVTSDEAHTLRVAGVEVKDEGGRLRLPQRCGALRGGADQGCTCTVYEKRPFVCRRFDCLLVRSVKEKELPVEEALDLVAEARARLNRLDGLLPRRNSGGADERSRVGTAGEPAKRQNEPSGPVLRAATLAQSGTKVSDSARRAFDEAQDHLRRHFLPD